MTIGEISAKYGVTADTLRYYERAGIIPPVRRTEGGIRDYSEQDAGWLELALCMRSAGLPVEAIAEYLKLFKEGDSTIPARLRLLTDQRKLLLARRKSIDETLDRLNYKIARYETAAETGKLTWESPEKRTADKSGEEK